MTEKELFIENFKAKTKKFAVDVINFCNTLKLSKASAVITYQLISRLLQLELIIVLLAVQGQNQNFIIKYALLPRKLTNHFIGWS